MTDRKFPVISIEALAHAMWFTEAAESFVQPRAEDWPGLPDDVRRDYIERATGVVGAMRAAGWGKAEPDSAQIAALCDEALGREPTDWFEALKDVLRLVRPDDA